MIASAYLSRVHDGPDVPEVTWIGASSFEERCVGSLRALDKMGRDVVKTVGLHYPTRVTPRDADVQKRGRNKRAIERLLKTHSAKGIEWMTVDPYVPSSLNRLFAEAEIAQSAQPVVIDITCLTKVHALALAAWLARNDSPEVFLAYTLPEQYGTPAAHTRDGGRWIGVALAPMLAGAIPSGDYGNDIFSEGVNGILLLGHERGRLALALSQCEPERALVVLARNQRHKRLKIVARAANTDLIPSRDSDTAGWRHIEIDCDLPINLRAPIERFMEDCSKDRRRLVLYPFGPKPLILQTALTTVGLLGSLVWYCYPIPHSYDVDYTLGCSSTLFFRVKRARTKK